MLIRVAAEMIEGEDPRHTSQHAAQSLGVLGFFKSSPRLPRGLLVYFAGFQGRRRRGSDRGGAASRILVRMPHAG